MSAPSSTGPEEPTAVPPHPDEYDTARHAAADLTLHPDWTTIGHPETFTFAGTSLAREQWAPST